MELVEQMDSDIWMEQQARGKKNLVALAYYAGSWIFSRYLGRENCYPIITITRADSQQLCTAAAAAAK